MRFGNDQQFGSCVGEQQSIAFCHPPILPCDILTSPNDNFSRCILQYPAFVEFLFVAFRYIRPFLDSVSHYVAFGQHGLMIH